MPYSGYQDTTERKGTIASHGAPVRASSPTAGDRDAWDSPGGFNWMDGGAGGGSGGRYDQTGRGGMVGNRPQQDPRQPTGLGGATKTPGRTLDDDINDYYKRLMDYYDPNGAYASQLTQSTQNSAYRAARDRGIRGPLSQTGAQQATAGALYGLAQHRDDLANAGLALRSNRDLGVQQLHQSENQFNANLAQRQAEQAQQQSNYNRENGFWGSQGLGGNLIGGLASSAGQIGGAYLGGGASLLGGAARSAAPYVYGGNRYSSGGR